MKNIKRNLKRKFPKKYVKKFLPTSFVLLLILTAFFMGVLVDRVSVIKSLEILSTTNYDQEKQNKPQINLEAVQKKVINDKGYRFNIKWGDLGKKMVEDGVIDKQKLAKAVTGTDNLPQELDKYLSTNQDKIELNQNNAQFWVDVLWGLGLANKNEILDKGPMVEGGNTANFASTGGYTIGASQPMDIYSKHSYINLSDQQQKEVNEITGNIYRPCCGNSAAFPDCNHGMAILGLVELMVSQNFSTEEIYKTALSFNTYWFPQTYLDIGYHFEKNGKNYSKIPPKEILSKTFSSAMGYDVVRKGVGQIEWPALKSSGGSCGA